MRYIRYACIAVFGIALVAVALANRQIATVQVLPDEVASLFAANPQISLPMFIVIYGGVLVGLFVGFVWEWFREHDQRAAGARSAREMRRLEREVKRLKGEKNADKDEVLAILDEAS